MTGFTVIYRHERLLGESGWTYQCFHNGNVVFEGWTRGAKSDAEAEVRRGIEARSRQAVAS